MEKSIKELIIKKIKKNIETLDKDIDNLKYAIEGNWSQIKHLHRIKDDNCDESAELKKVREYFIKQLELLNGDE